MNKFLSILKWVGIALLVFSIQLPISFFVYNFWGQSLSGSPEQWGQFGDYFGGIFNPILAIVNVCFLIYISRQVAELEDKRSIELSLLEDRRHLNEFRYAAYKPLLIELDKITKINATEPQVDFDGMLSMNVNFIYFDLKLYEIKLVTENFERNNERLFLSHLDLYKSSLYGIIDAIEKLIIDIQSQKRNRLKGNKDTEEIIRAINSGWIEFDKRRTELSRFFQDAILNRL